MKIEDAACILNINGELTKDIIKRAYRLACSKYHPDKGGSLEMMKAVNLAYDVLKTFEGNVCHSNENYNNHLNDVINKIKCLKGICIEVCGAWLWVTGETKQHAKLLGRKEGGAGLYYATKKKAWYYRPEEWKSSNRGNWSMEYIRDKHGSKVVKNKYSRAICKT